MISNRLKSLVKYIDDEDKIIDIGCDHALLDIYLIKNKVIDKIIVSDVHKQALDAGIANIKKYHYEGRIDARLGDGLEVLNDKDDVNTILISGMGTSTIKSILKDKSLDKIDKMIIQSNNDHGLLREYMITIGYYISAEEYFVDHKKNYINIVFKKGSKKYSKIELKYGPYLINDVDYLNFELNNCIKIFNLIPNMKIRYRLRLKREMKLLNKLIDKIK